MAHYRTTPADTDRMPPGIPYIIGNEAAERFSYYGMRTILTVFMFRYLFLMSESATEPMTEAQAQEHYHTFTSWVYLFPIIGAIVADALTGKYRLIVGVSVLYCLGHLALAFIGAGGLEAEQWMWVGLFLIAVGGGGIKPCVSAHVGDQFGTRNQHLMEKVYQWFYFSINFGSTISTLLTPWVLEWYGPHVAFGVPGVLMALATLTFWLGRNRYIHVPPGGMTFLKEVFSREGLLTILRLSLVYLTITVFWALFDQTGSAWVLQAENMNLHWLGIDWLPSQLQAINPILVMLFIPLFQFALYPAINRVFRLTPLRKIGLGLFIMTAGFGLSAVVQGWIDDGLRPSIAWQFVAYCILTTAEIMVSITGLEFSYAQAPKSMKSVIMAVWLLSVSLGNSVTAAVNHWIQVPHAAGVGAAAAAAAEAGPLAAAKERIDAAFFASASDDAAKALPSDSDGSALIDGVTDSHSRPIRYKRMTRDRYRLVADGPDAALFTPDDVVVAATVTRANPEKAARLKTMPLTWREKRIIELQGEAGRREVEDDRGASPVTKIEGKTTVGGLVTLEGAAYYWFWTTCMLAGAVAFVPIAVFYRGRSHFQDEAEAA